jgi:TetR/AcrR family transcriptional regulator, regulator of cefoperazone and chloramphenicol sensitivity
MDNNVKTRTEERPEPLLRRPTSPRRRPATGGYARGEEKRLRIIETAIHRFGEDGYDGASTRDIAQQAGVNPPAVQYYFHSKEGLYAACFEHIIGKFSAVMQDVYRRADAIGPGEAEAARDVFCDLLDAMAEFLFETAESDGWRRFAARVKAHDSPCRFEDLEKSLEAELFGHCFHLVAVATADVPTSDSTKLRTFGAMGALTAFHHERDSMLELLNWPDLRGARLAQLKALVRSQAKAALA